MSWLYMHVNAKNSFSSKTATEAANIIRQKLPVLPVRSRQYYPFEAASITRQKQPVLHVRSRQYYTSEAASVTHRHHSSGNY